MLGELLLGDGIITDDDLYFALQYQSLVKPEMRLGEILIEKEYINQATLDKYLKIQQESI